MAATQTVQLIQRRHRESDVIFINCDYNTEMDEFIRGLAGRKWSRTHRCWYVENKEGTISRIFDELQGKAITQLITYDAVQRPEKKDKQANSKPHAPLPVLDSESAQRIKAFSDWMNSRRYSGSTISTYCEALATFFRFFDNKKPEEINNDDLVRFNNQYILANYFSGSYQNQVVNAVKLFFSTMENRKLQPDLVHRPRRAKVLPNVLSKEEVKMILNWSRNIKHKAMLSLIYACGLRCGELLSLKPTHVDSKRGVLIIKQAKGFKDRLTPLSDKILVMLREYYLLYRPKIYLFEGQTVGLQYDSRSLQQVLKNSVNGVGINKPVTLHWLRHSYATHLLESGTDLRYIQEILGHASSRTTEIYTHVSNKALQKIVSPFDSL